MCQDGYRLPQGEFGTWLKSGQQFCRDQGEEPSVWRVVEASGFIGDTRRP